jgi:hypothetical protein
VVELTELSPKRATIDERDDSFPTMDVYHLDREEIHDPLTAFDY